MSHTHDLQQEHTQTNEKALFGFWVYLMTDCVLFASLFATYAVLRANTYGGPGGAELFDMPFVLIETLILLVSSLTSGLGYYWSKRGKANQVIVWSVITFLLGSIFLAMELHEFRQLVAESNGWQRSGFLTAFFTLVGTHGIHILVGLIWLAVMLRQVVARGLTHHVQRRLAMFSMYWHFLDVVWIFVFTIVYLIGAANV